MGQIFSQSGYELIFIDISESVIETLNRDGRYPVRIMSENGSKDDWIEGVRAINGSNTGEAADAIAAADCMAVSVGVRAMKFIAPVIASGIKKRIALNGNPLDIIICENLLDAGKILADLIKEYLDNGEKIFFDENIGLVDASIGRMVPVQTPQMQDGNPLRVCVEKYCFLPVDKTAFRGKIPNLAGMYPVDNFEFYIKQKLFIHNMGHAVCAYMGMIRGNKYICETVSHGGILFVAQNAMTESALALSSRYNVPFADIHCHIMDLLLRFSNSALGDTCARVGADTVRKLGANDRFIGAIRFCKNTNVNPVFISAGASAALYCHLAEKRIPQTMENACTVLKELADMEGAEAEKILSFYSILIDFPQSGNFDTIIGKIIITALNESG